MPVSIWGRRAVFVWPRSPVHEWSTDMRLTTTLAAAAALSVSAVAASAGGMSEEVMEAPVVMAEPMEEPFKSSISPTYVVVGVLAALLIAAAAAE